MENGKKKYEHSGHRQRMLKKASTQALPPHERLEILLFSILPRYNTADLAHRLLGEFGSLEKIFTASVEELCKVEGIGANAAAYLYNIGALFRTTQMPSLQRPTAKQVFLGEFSAEKFLPYAHELCKNEPKEFVAWFFLDENAEVFKVERMEYGNKNSLTFDPASVSKYIHQYAPSGLVMVHNHPDDNVVASTADEETTRTVQMICSLHNVIFCDHIVCSKQGVYSYYMSGRMQNISKRFSTSVMKVEENEDV